MADNVSLPASGVTAASDEIGGFHHQRVKLSQGADGTAVDVSSAAPLHVTQQAPTATLSNVSSSATNVTLLASNTARRGAYVFNDSTSVLYVKFGATASATSFTAKLYPDQFYEAPIPVYTGIIDGIWVAANGSARCTEIS